MDQSGTFAFEPIGVVRTGKPLKFSVPHQPDFDRDDVNHVLLEPGKQFELALQDLNGFDHIWLISWFHLNQNWRPRPLPPRGPAIRRGLFATRSPHRPNPIGLTCARLIAIDELTLIVGPVDLVDGTPILDIKPYLPNVDSFSESRFGWVEEVEEQLAIAKPFTVIVEEPAKSQLSWLKTEHGIDFTERAFALLAYDPSPHRTRRILKMPTGFRMACGPWRVFYQVVDNTVHIQSIGKGYSEESLSQGNATTIPDWEAQIAFKVQFG